MNNTTTTITDGEKEQNKRIKANLAEVDWTHTSLEELEDVFEDRDPLEFL
jgi:hypothetical protein